MIGKFKGLCFGCFKELDVVNPSDIMSQIKDAPSKEFSFEHSKTENDTTVTQNNFLTTSEDEPAFKGPKLKLIAFEGGIVALDKKFLINGKGMEFGGRKKEDGVVYIGRNLLSAKTNTIINDIALDDPDVGERHCMIRYNKNLKKYFLRDQGQGSGTFIKVEEPKTVISSSIVSFNDSHMALYVTQCSSKESESRVDKSSSEKDILIIRFLEGSNANEEYEFKPSEHIVKIGRSIDCQIKLGQNSSSPYQCSMKYVDNAWRIYDGADGNNSTNGTWIFAENYYEITHRLVFKVGKTLFRVEFENPLFSKLKPLTLKNKTKQ